MSRDLNFDDDCDLGSDGGNVIPWGPGTSRPGQPTMLNRENLSEFEALMLGEVSNDGCSSDDNENDTESAAPASSADDDNDESFFPFMDLPLEIRLQVYRWIHLMTPIRLTQFAPWYPNPIHRTYHVKVVTLDSKDDSGGDDSQWPPSSHTNTLALAVEDLDDPPTPHPWPASSPPTCSPPVLLSASRPHCCMPTDVLRASQQIYHESRAVPFAENEFVFVNWFASGLWAARSFVRGLCPWQTQSMRYARLELLSRDLSGRYADDWRELCEAWALGLRGLRLKILGGGGGGLGAGAGAGTAVSWVVAGAPQKGAPTVEVRDGEGKAEEWVERGLKRLKQLRFLEVELAVADWDDRAKLDWCRRLEEAVNESKTKTERRVRVSCVEKEVQ
ncbi:hypothetical protein GGR54DRAFT_633577 [Hypoxylon sp. NC1633]|nr:hypothetical protein GGR54DRAFT_633577 [Hypoxylon sp. NC1633]